VPRPRAAKGFWALVPDGNPERPVRGRPMRSETSMGATKQKDWMAPSADKGGRSLLAYQVQFARAAAPSLAAARLSSSLSSLTLLILTSAPAVRRSIHSMYA